MFSTGTSMFSIRVRQKSPYGAIGAKKKPWVPAFQEDSIGVEAVPSPSASRLDGAVTERGAPAWGMRCNGRITDLKWFIGYLFEICQVRIVT